MKYKIQLTENKNILLDNRDELTLPEEIKITFSSQLYCVDTLLITARNGIKQKQFKLRDKEELDLSEFTFAGRLYLDIQMIVNGKTVKLWSVEPIVIKEISGQFEQIPEIEQLRNEVATLKTAVVELKNLIIKEEEI